MLGPVAVDANLLLLLLVGSTSRSYIIKHKRLRGVYTEHDFDLLEETVAAFSRIVVLPNTLTELSNNLRYINDPARSEIAFTMRQFIEAAKVSESFVPSRSASMRPEFFALGLTDCALLNLMTSSRSGAQPTLLTVDLDLAVAAEMNGHPVINFNHTRDAAL